MVQMDILGPFYIHQSSARNYIISCIDDCSRKVASKCTERKRSIDVLDVLERWIMINGKPKKIMHDNGKQFTSKIFKRFLEHNNIKDKPIPNNRIYKLVVSLLPLLSESTVMGLFNGIPQLEKG